MDHAPRYSARPLPPYSYVSGHAPHPVSDPRGHSYGHAPTRPPALDPDRWRDSEAYRYGIDLFNDGFYWEAHEVWESLWQAAGRRGPVATWLKALIKLAAGAVKLREGNAAGAGRHANRALALLEEVKSQAETTTCYCGVRFENMVQIAAAIIAASNEGALIADPKRRLMQWLKLNI
jgi:predicted metal-dependent hydrolase